MRRVEFYLGKDADWYWRQWSSNGRIVSASSEGFKSRSGAIENWETAVLDGSKLLDEGSWNANATVRAIDD